MFDIHALPIYDDNYVWIITSAGKAWVIDPGDHQPVVEFLLERKLDLAAILITHRHWDHVTGVRALADSAGSPCTPVYGPDSEPIRHLVTHTLREGDVITIGPLQAEVWQTPGHTLDHICYYVAKQNMIFCGDTLFASGCGRLFDGSMQQLYDSLQRLARLPPQTQVYCTHEYTLANIDFALAAEPDNVDLQQRQSLCQQLRDADHSTLPTTIDSELATNPFLRCRQPQVRAMVKKRTGASIDGEFSCFRALRNWKNRY